MFDGSLSKYIYDFVVNYGYIAVFLGLAIEGTGMPGPVEILFFASGYMIARDNFSFWAVLITATLGNLTGNLISYFLGYYGGRPFVDKYGHYLHLKQEDITKVSKWYDKYGGVVVFASRLIGVTRTPAILISGVSRMKLLSYVFFCLTADFIWASFWTIIGTQSINILTYLKGKGDILYIVVALVILIIIFVWWKFIKIYKARRT